MNTEELAYFEKLEQSIRNEFTQLRGSIGQIDTRLRNMELGVAKEITAMQGQVLTITYRVEQLEAAQKSAGQQNSTMDKEVEAIKDFTTAKDEAQTKRQNDFELKVTEWMESFKPIRTAFYVLSSTLIISIVGLIFTIIEAKLRVP